MGNPSDSSFSSSASSRDFSRDTASPLRYAQQVGSGASPAHIRPSATMPSAKSPETSTAKPKARPVLLVVDDEEGPRQSLKVVFKNDYEVLLANSGEAALEVAKEHSI